MVGYLEAINVMHTRSITIDEKDYMFALMVVVGEEPQKAYAFAYDMATFKKHIGTESEDEYLLSKKQEAENTLLKQNITQLKDLLAESLRTQIQSAALNLKDYSFTGQEAVQILNNILKSRIEDIDSASVRDVVSVIKQLTEQGALETGDGGFSRHFITVPKKYDSYCPNCNHELYAVEGLDIKCSYCGQMFKWRDNRFYPEMQKL